MLNMTAITHVRTPKEMIPVKVAKLMTAILILASFLGLASVVGLISMTVSSSLNGTLELCPAVQKSESLAQMIVLMFGSSLMVIEFAFLSFYIRFSMKTRSAVGETKTVAVTETIAKHGLANAILGCLMLVAFVASRGDELGWKSVLANGVIRMFLCGIFLLWVHLKVSLMRLRAHQTSQTSNTTGQANSKPATSGVVGTLVQQSTVPGSAMSLSPVWTLTVKVFDWFVWKLFSFALVSMGNPRDTTSDSPNKRIKAAPTFHSPIMLVPYGEADRMVPTIPAPAPPARDDPWRQDDSLAMIFLNAFRQRLQADAGATPGSPDDERGWHITVLRPSNEDSGNGWGATRVTIPQAAEEDDGDDDFETGDAMPNWHPLLYSRLTDTPDTETDENVPPVLERNGDVSVSTRRRVEHVQRLSSQQEAARRSHIQRMTDIELEDEHVRIQRLIASAQSDRMTTAFLRARLMMLQDVMQQRLGATAPNRTSSESATRSSR
jgi:hypothetical protein